MLQCRINTALSRRRFRSIPAEFLQGGSRPSTQRIMTMTNTVADAQKFGQANMEAGMKAFGDITKNWQTLATEMTNFSQRSFEDGTQTLEKLMAVKSFDQAMEIQTSFAKRQYDQYMQQLTKFGGLYSDIAKETYKPVERALQTTR
jgi:hypothetical protein